MKTHRRSLALAAIATLSTVLTTTSRSQAQNYVGPNLGDWDAAGNWSPATVPNTGSAAVTVSNGNTVLLPSGPIRNVGTLNIGATSGVSIPNNTYLVINGATFVDNGLTTVTSTGSDTRLRTAGQSLTVSGTGAINLVNGALDGGGTIINSAGHTIRGYGSVGLNNTAFANAGIITANVSGQTLSLDPANATSTNTGTISASNGGILSFTGGGGGAFTNTGGTFLANTGSEVSLTSSAMITGGTLSSAGTGVIRAATGVFAYINDFTNNADLRVGNNAYLALGGTVVNSKTITLENTTGDTRLRSNGANLNLTGTGTISMPTGGSIDGGANISFGSGQTVQGTGSIGLNNTTFTNNGLVQANLSGKSLTIDPANAGATSFDNNATLLATAGGTLVLTGGGGGAVDNTGGIVRADTGSQVQMVASNRVANGILTTVGTGTILVPAGDTAYLDNVTNTGAIHIGNNADLYFSGTFTNNGTVTLDNVAGSRFRTQGADITIAGSGSIEMPTGGTLDNVGRITIASTQTIRGQGSIGANNAAFTNAGLIDANVTGATLTLDPANVATAFVNTGTLRSSNGGVLSFTGGGGGDFYNAGGTITAVGAGSRVNLMTSARIIGGTLTTSGGTLVEPANETAYLQDATLASTLTITGNADLYIENSLTNNGIITYAPINNTTTRLRATGAATAINGTGQIILNNTAATADDTMIDGGGTLTLGSGQTVRGSGSIGANNTAIVNNGIIDADNAAGGIGLDPSNTPAGFQNNNILRATGGGKLSFTGGGGGAFTNSPTATITATGANSEVQLTSSAQISGGTLATSGGGIIREMPNQSAYIGGTTKLTGQLRIDANADLYLNGSLTNNGTITLSPTTGGTASVRLRTDGADRTIAGTGTIVLANVAGADATIDGGGRFTFAAGQTITGSGSIGANNTAFTNNGTIVSDHGGITIDPANVATSFTNNGTIRATTGGLVEFTGGGGGTFSGGGTFVADVNSKIRANNSASMVFATNMTGAGTFEAANSADAQFTSYQVDTVNVTSSAYARITAGGGNAGTSKVHTLTVENANGAHVDVTDHGIVLDYTGSNPTSTIRGYIISGRNNGTWNGAGINSSAITGTNRAIGYIDTALTGASGTFLGQTYDNTSVLIRYTVSGDANLDGTTSFPDLVALAQNYQAASPATWAKGDFNYDGIVNFDDLVLLAQNYSTSALDDGIGSLSASGSFAGDWALAQSLVPEPTSLSLIAAAAGLIIRRRR